jgi:hypothetical protein
MMRPRGLRWLVLFFVVVGAGVFRVQGYSNLTNTGWLLLQEYQDVQHERTEAQLTQARLQTQLSRLQNENKKLEADIQALKSLASSHPSNQPTQTYIRPSLLDWRSNIDDEDYWYDTALMDKGEIERLFLLFQKVCFLCLPLPPSLPASRFLASSLLPSPLPCLLSTFPA